MSDRAEFEKWYVDTFGRRPTDVGYETDICWQAWQAARAQRVETDHIADDRKMVNEAEQFCDLNCTWLDHHPDCTVPIGYMGFSPDGHTNKFRRSEFGNSIPVYAHPLKIEQLNEARQIIAALVEYAECNDPGNPHIGRAKAFLGGGDDA